MLVASEPLNESATIVVTVSGILILLKLVNAKYTFVLSFESNNPFSNLKYSLTSSMFIFSRLLIFQKTPLPISLNLLGNVISLIGQLTKT